MKSKKWNNNQLREAVRTSKSVRQVLIKLKLRPAGGNYAQITATIKKEKISTKHFTGQAWNKGLHGIGKPRLDIKRILTKQSTYQSYKLKKRLFTLGLKKQHCEKCGWAKKSIDGRIPLELDHINGNRYDNRITNLRVLCPNCHSLEPTHRGLNKNRPGHI